ncbi:MAG: TfoX/Sxy family DNA transformation protein [Sandaracinaceae bacterium]
MDDLDNDSLDLTPKAPSGLFDSILKDDGAQRAAAGVLIAAGWLREEGIETYADLAAADRLALFLTLKAGHRQVTRLMYYALWGAVENRHWRECPEDEKTRVDAALEALR